jgi:hypothetical protein
MCTTANLFFTDGSDEQCRSTGPSTMRYEFINSPGVESIDLTDVDIVDGDVIVVGNQELATLNLQSLQTTQYDFVVAGSTAVLVHCASVRLLHSDK